MIITATLKSTGQKISAELKEKKICFCGRDIKVEEFMEIVKTLRKGETYDGKGKSTMFDRTKEMLFYCAIHDQKPHKQFTEVESSYQAVVQELNAMFKKYEINTCLRKIHFLAQAYHETDRFRSPIEHRKLTDLDGFIGRGFVHLTHKYNYFKYTNYYLGYTLLPPVKENDKSLENRNLKDLYNTEALLYTKIKTEGWEDKVKSIRDCICTSLWFALDSAGWYWINGEEKSGGVTPKNKNTNLIADEGVSDGICEKITKNINGGINGIDKRKLYTKLLKEIMDYENCSNKK